MRGPTTRRVAVAVAMASALLTARRAAASFDIVGVYQSKVKQFEAVYFLEKDENWHRDRRVFELFGEGDYLSYTPASQPGEDHALSIWSGSGGLLLNVRPAPMSRVQLSLFTLYNSARKPLPTSYLVAGGREGNGGVLTELLHGARLTVGDLAEVSLGAYWLDSSTNAYTSGTPTPTPTPGVPTGAAPTSTSLSPSATARGSFFAELNLPSLYAKSSYVIGKNLSSQADSLQRFDLRFPIDTLSFVENIEVGVVRYNFVEPKWMMALDIQRLGVPSFKFASASLRYSRTDGELAWFKGGLDVMLQSDDDFNLTRRGHFGTSFGVQAFYTRVSPSGMNLFGAATSPAGTVTGYELTATMQIPAKWFMTALMVVGAAAAQTSNDLDDSTKDFMAQQAAQALANTIEEPRDILFTRLNITYSKNAPETFAILTTPEDRGRLFVSVSFIY